MASAMPAAPTSSLRITLWVLLVVYIFNFLDRQIVTILAEPISQELGLSDTQIGLMTGLAFALFYTMLGIPIARYADKTSSNRVRIISVALAVWSAMTMLCGFANNFVQLLLARIGVGVGEAGCTPAAHSLITDSTTPENRSSAMSFYGLGIPIGGLLGMVVGGYLNDLFGWRTTFVIVGVPGIALAFLVPLFLKEPRKFKVVEQKEMLPQLSLSEAFAEIAKSRAFLLIAVASSITAFLAYGKTVWSTILFLRSYNLSASETGLYLGLAIGLSGIFGTWLGGWLADRYGKIEKRHILTGPAIGMTFAAPMLFIAYASPSWAAALGILVVPTILNSLYYGPTYACVQSLVKPQARAVASAVMLFAQNLIGLGLGPLLFGMLSDAFKPIAGDESVRWVLYGAAWLGLIPAFFFWRASLRLKEELSPNASAPYNALKALKAAFPGLRP
jgi:MFS family permease